MTVPAAAPGREAGASIPAYALYGETSAWLIPDLVHCETIHARSTVHNWHIHPHRHPALVQLLFLASGESRMSLETREQRLRGPALVWLPAGAVHGYRFQPDVIGHVVTLPSFALADRLGDDPAAAEALGEAFVARGPEHREALEALAPVFERLHREFRATRPARALAMDGALGLIFAALVRLAEVTRHEAAPRENRAIARLAKFRGLVDEHYREHRSVPQYARMLGVSPQQLRNDCRRNGEPAPLVTVHERVLLEAKRMLVYTRMSVAEIGYALGYADIAYFCRFFRREAGMSPTQYRSRADYGRRRERAGVADG